METDVDRGEEEAVVQDDEESDKLLKEAYAEAEKEQKAAALRAEKPLEERQAEFKKMLLERGVGGGGRGGGGGGGGSGKAGLGEGRWKGRKGDERRDEKGTEPQLVCAIVTGVSILYVGEGTA